LDLYGHDLRPLAASRRGLKCPRRFKPAALGGLGVLSRLWPRLLPLYPLPGGSQDAEPVIGGSQRAARLQGVPQPVFLRRLGQCPADGLLGELSRDDDSPVVIGHHEVPGTDLQAADDISRRSSARK
jgi:hypothetical protein